MEVQNKSNSMYIPIIKEQKLNSAYILHFVKSNRYKVFIRTNIYVGINSIILAGYTEIHQHAFKLYCFIF